MRRSRSISIRASTTTRCSASRRKPPPTRSRRRIASSPRRTTRTRPAATRRRRRASRRSRTRTTCSATRRRRSTTTQIRAGGFRSRHGRRPGGAPTRTRRRAAARACSISAICSASSSASGQARPGGRVRVERVDFDDGSAGRAAAPRTPPADDAEFERRSRRVRRHLATRRGQRRPLGRADLLRPRDPGHRRDRRDRRRQSRGESAAWHVERQEAAAQRQGCRRTAPDRQVITTSRCRSTSRRTSMTRRRNCWFQLVQRCANAGTTTEIG